MSDVTSYRVTGDWRHIVDDGMTDPDAEPDHAYPSGHVLFEAIDPDFAQAGDPTLAYTLASVTAPIAEGILVDNEDREGIWLAGLIGDTPVTWRATTHLEYAGQTLAYPVLEFELVRDTHITGIEPHGGGYRISTTAAPADVVSHPVTGDWRHIVDDGMVDLDALPDEALPTGKVTFHPVWPAVATAGDPAVAYTFATVTALVAAGELRDLQGRSGVWLAGRVGVTPIQWLAVTDVSFQGQKIKLPDVELVLDGPARLTSLYRDSTVWPAPVVTAVEGHRLAAEDAADRAETAAETADAAIVAAAAQVVAEVEDDRVLAEQAQTGAVEARAAAEEAAEDAAGHAGTADTRASAAGQSEANAKISETNAGLSEQAAADKAIAADGSRAGAVEARDEARDARDQADGFRNEAGTHAATAADKAAEAGTKATQAADFTTTTRTYRDQAEAARDIAVANGLRWRGTWAAGTAYAAQDVVTHAGSSWRAVDASTGVEPAEGASWSMVAARGAPGQSGATEITWDDVLDKPGTFTPETHTHGPEDLGSGGTRSGTTFLNGLGNWVTPYTVMSSAEADTGTDTTPRVLSAARLREVIQQRVTGAAGTAVSLIGQALNRATTKADARAAIGAVADDDERLTNPRTPTDHKHPVPDGLTASGTPSASTYLRGDGSWQTPANTTYSVMSQAEAENSASTTARLATGQRLHQAVAANPRLSAAPATWRWNGTSLPTAASQVHAQARAGDFIVAPNLATDPGWHQITGV